MQIFIANDAGSSHHIDVRRQSGGQWRFMEFYSRFRTLMSERLEMHGGHMHMRMRMLRMHMHMHMHMRMHMHVHRHLHMHMHVHTHTHMHMHMHMTMSMTMNMNMNMHRCGSSIDRISNRQGMRIFGVRVLCSTVSAPCCTCDLARSRVYHDVPRGRPLVVVI